MPLLIHQLMRMLLPFACGLTPGVQVFLNTRRRAVDCSTHPRRSSVAPNAEAAGLFSIHNSGLIAGLSVLSIQVFSSMNSAHSRRLHVGTANLLPQKPLALALRQRRALNGSRLLDKRRIKSSRNSRDDSVIIARELGGRYRNRCCPPYMVVGVTQEPSKFGLPGWCIECRSAMACADGRQARESC